MNLSSALLPRGKKIIIDKDSKMGKKLLRDGFLTTCYVELDRDKLIAVRVKNPLEGLVMVLEMSKKDFRLAPNKVLEEYVFCLDTFSFKPSSRTIIEPTFLEPTF